MRKLFADASYWIALLHAGDLNHQKAVDLSNSLGRVIIFTSDWVLAEVLNFFAGNGILSRKAAVQLVQKVLNDSNCRVVPASRELFVKGLGLYSDRLDKNWGVIDCISFIIMTQNDISEALAYDHHFIQAGFQALLRDRS